MPGRFETMIAISEHDGWDIAEERPAPIRTSVTAETAKSIVSRNSSPDIPFSQSINPYRGCEHACAYCFARPSHSYLNLSPGLDFETKLFFKENAAALLEKELSRPGYKCSPIALGANTDPYQPIERDLRITRSILEVLRRYRHPVTIVTKGAALLGRDIDLLAEMARDCLASVTISLTTMDDDLKRKLEPMTTSGAGRIKIIRQLTDAGVPVTALLAPIIPFINDGEIENLLELAADNGARTAGYVTLRLPHEVKTIFREWLVAHYPLKVDHVMSLVTQMHDGKEYNSQWGTRQKGSGHFADLIAKRFEIACRRFGYLDQRAKPLSTGLFRTSEQLGAQLSLLP